MQCNWKNLKKRPSRWRDPESEKRTKGKRDAKANFTYDTQLVFATLNKDTKTEENTSNEDASIRDRNREAEYRSSVRKNSFAPSMAFVTRNET